MNSVPCPRSRPETIVMVMPVYNERENIPLLIEKFSPVRNRISDFSIEICFVDDDSPDGTGTVISELSEVHGWVHLLHRDEKEGLGMAYLAGFDYALEHLDPDFLGQMDSDLSHDPEVIISMVKCLEAGSDVVIGSRYTNGGGIEGWPLPRRIISRGGNIFARYIGGISGVKDCTSGFRLIKSDKLRTCLSSGMIPTRGYSFQIHLLSSLIDSESVVTEVPMVFKERVHGQSKLGNGDVREFISTVSRLRFSGKGD